jgi:hypothetical protein
VRQPTARQAFLAALEAVLEQAEELLPRREPAVDWWELCQLLSTAAYLRNEVAAAL